jgi:hypothetical protein
MGLGSTAFITTTLALQFAGVLLQSRIGEFGLENAARLLVVL